MINQVNDWGIILPPQVTNLEGGFNWWSKAGYLGWQGTFRLSKFCLHDRISRSKFALYGQISSTSKSGSTRSWFWGAKNRLHGDFSTSKCVLHKHISKLRNLTYTVKFRRYRNMPYTDIFREMKFSLIGWISNRNSTYTVEFLVLEIASTRGDFEEIHLLRFLISKSQSAQERCFSAERWKKRPKTTHR